jgi:hypothetical protein
MEKKFIRLVGMEVAEYLKAKKLEVTPENITAYLMQYGYITKPTITQATILKRFFELYKLNGCLKKRTVDDLAIEINISETYIYNTLGKQQRRFRRRKDIDII